MSGLKNVPIRQGGAVFFSGITQFHDKLRESGKNRESGRQHIKSEDSRSNREGWNVWISDTVLPSKGYSEQVVTKLSAE